MKRRSFLAGCGPLAAGLGRLPRPRPESLPTGRVATSGPVILWAGAPGGLDRDSDRGLDPSLQETLDSPDGLRLSLAPQAPGREPFRPRLILGSGREGPIPQGTLLAQLRRAPWILLQESSPLAWLRALGGEGLGAAYPRALRRSLLAAHHRGAALIAEGRSAGALAWAGLAHPDFDGPVRNPRRVRIGPSDPDNPSWQAVGGLGLIPALVQPVGTGSKTSFLDGLASLHELDGPEFLALRGACSVHFQPPRRGSRGNSWGTWLGPGGQIWRISAGRSRSEPGRRRGLAMEVQLAESPERSPRDPNPRGPLDLDRLLSLWPSPGDEVLWTDPEAGWILRISALEGSPTGLRARLALGALDRGPKWLY